LGDLFGIFNGLRLKEVGGFFRDAFAQKNFSFTTNLSAEYIATNFFWCCYGLAIYSTVGKMVTMNK